MRTDNRSDEGAAAVADGLAGGGLGGGGPALFRLVRFWSRRWAADAARQGAGDAGHVGHVLILEAIDAAAGAGQGGPGTGGPGTGGVGTGGAGTTAAIADVAVQLGLDRSNASRMLASAVAAGLV